MSYVTVLGMSLSDSFFNVTNRKQRTGKHDWSAGSLTSALLGLKPKHLGLQPRPAHVRFTLTSDPSGGHVAFLATVRIKWLLGGGPGGKLTSQQVFRCAESPGHMCTPRSMLFTGRRFHPEKGSSVTISWSL